MNPDEMSQRWQEQSQEVSRSIAQWRQAHPKATLAEIEAAVDVQMNQLRARMSEDVALASPAEQRETKPQRSTCPQCGHHLQSRGKRARSLQTQGGQDVRLTRTYQSCPSCGYSFFPPR